ncbi:MAG TPA: type II toxin-antitoxin system HigB family toxin [Arachidicoccus sp.]|nr:type II toxin-antitoxin system HigB family toxin [Arachidicoccus sp.]
MVIITKRKLLVFGKKHPLAIVALNNWYDISKKANWRNFSEIKRDFNSVDAVGADRFVFNIKGNDYRLVVMIHFDIRTIYVRFIGTHNAYNKIDCKSV